MLAQLQWQTEWTRYLIEGLILLVVGIVVGIILLILEYRTHWFALAFKFDKWLKNPPKVVEDTRGTKEIFLIEEGYRRLIPNMPTFFYLGEYFNFRTDNVTPMRLDEIRKIPQGRDLPDILSHCKKAQAGLTIHSAVWGAKHSMKDVTREVSGLISNDKLDMKVSVDTLGDHIQDTKWLMVVYSYDGELKIKTAVEDDNLILP